MLFFSLVRWKPFLLHLNTWGSFPSNMISFFSLVTSV